MEAVAAATAAAVAAATVWRLGPSPTPPTRAARLVSWLALALPIPTLVLAPTDRFLLLVTGRSGGFEALRTAALAACAAAAVHVLASLKSLRRPAGAPGVLLLTGSAAVAGLAAALAVVL